MNDSALTITGVVAIPLTASMQAGTRTSQGVYNQVSIVLVEVRTQDGIVGYGECLGRFGARAYAGFINEVLALGFKAIKVKLGTPVARAIEAAAQVRAIAGPDILLGADANWAYTLDDAVAVGRGLHALHYWFFEEPIMPEDVAGYAHLRRCLPIMLAAGESDTTVAHAAQLLDDRLVDINLDAVDRYRVDR